LTLIQDVQYILPELILTPLQYIRENSNGIMPTKQFLQPSDDFRCNSGSFNKAGSTKVAKLNAGDTLGFELWYYATMKHPGPLTIHMSKAPGGTFSRVYVFADLH
jgi:hypothetical protein